jgi:hypothetical protein
MAPVVTDIENIYVKIAWSYPVDNSDTVTEYDIQILESDQLTYSSDVLYCDGRS